MPPNSSHLTDVIDAVRTRITSLTALFGEMDVEIGNPAQFHPRADSSPPLVTIFVYRIEPDNAAMLATPNTAAAMRLHTLLTVHCTNTEDSAESLGSLELRILSHIIRLFHENSTVGPVRIREAIPVGPIASLVSSDIEVEARQMAPDMEEINHIWTTQADTPYRTSLVYRFSFGIITPSRPSDEGPPVLSTELGDRDHPNDVGVTPFIPDEVAEPEPAQGVLSVNTGSGVAPRFVPTKSFVAGSGNATISLVAVTEAAETLDLSLEVFDQSTGQWTDGSASIDTATITTLARQALADGGVVINTDVTIVDPGAAQVFRITASRSVEPQTLAMSEVVVTVEEP